ncbi:thiamine phosphate synthase [Okibacterium endophyticum]
MTRVRNADLSLYLVTDSGQSLAAGRAIDDTVAEAVAGGVTAVQVREKDASARDMLDTVLRIAELIPDGVSLFVNDRVDVFQAARASGARVTGVHVGQSDLSAVLVRQLIGPEPVIGVSAATPEQLRDAAAHPGVVDYVGIGALHPTRSKRDAPAALGHRAAARLIAATTLPAVVIGGVNASDLPRLRAAGAAGAAIVSAICAADDPRAAAAHLVTAWKEGTTA